MLCEVKEREREREANISCIGQELFEIIENYRDLR